MAKSTAASKLIRRRRPFSDVTLGQIGTVRWMLYDFPIHIEPFGSHGAEHYVKIWAMFI